MLIILSLSGSCQKVIVFKGLRQKDFAIEESPDSSITHFKNIKDYKRHGGILRFKTHADFITLSQYVIKAANGEYLYKAFPQLTLQHVQCFPTHKIIVSKIDFDTYVDVRELGTDIQLHHDNDTSYIYQSEPPAPDKAKSLVESISVSPILINRIAFSPDLSLHKDTNHLLIKSPARSSHRRIEVYHFSFIADLRKDLCNP